jgi:hypothetical protein
VPYRVIRYATMKWVLMMPEMLIHPLAISSATSAYVSSDSPSPPYSGSMVSPKTPSLASPATIRSG